MGGFYNKIRVFGNKGKKMKLVSYSCAGITAQEWHQATSLTTCACAPLSASASACASTSLITTTSRSFVRHYKILIYILAKEKNINEKMK